MMVSKSLRNRSPASRSAWRCSATVYSRFSSPPFLQHATSSSRCCLQDWLVHLRGAHRTPAWSPLQPCLNSLRWSSAPSARAGRSLDGGCSLFPPQNSEPRSRSSPSCRWGGRCVPPAKNALWWQVSLPRGHRLSPGSREGRLGAGTHPHRCSLCQSHLPGCGKWGNELPAGRESRMHTASGDLQVTLGRYGQAGNLGI